MEKETVLDMGEVKITKSKEPAVILSPFAGDLRPVYVPFPG